MNPEVPSVQPLGSMLPGIYTEDRFAQGLTEGLDAVLSSLLNTLDNLDAYFDPELAPADFLDWLAGWLGLVRNPFRSVADTRNLVRRVAEIYRWRGTVQGLSDHIALTFGVTPEITESGGVTVSPTSRTAPPGSGRVELVVRVTVDAPQAFPAELLDQFVAANKPAHVPHRVHVRGAGGAPAAPLEPAGAPPAGALPHVGRSPYRGYGPVRPGDP